MAGGSQEYARLTEKTNEFYAAFAGTALLRIFSRIRTIFISNCRGWKTAWTGKRKWPGMKNAWD